MNLGYSHQVIVSEVEGITIEVPSPNKIIIRGCVEAAVQLILGRTLHGDRGAFLFNDHLRAQRAGQLALGSLHSDHITTRGCAPRSPALPRCRA